MKILKVEFHEETDTALFCWVTMLKHRIFRNPIEVKELFYLDRFGKIDYSSFSKSVNNNLHDLNLEGTIARLMLLSKKGVVEL